MEASWAAEIEGRIERLLSGGAMVRSHTHDNTASHLSSAAVSLLTFLDGLQTLEQSLPTFTACQDGT